MRRVVLFFDSFSPFGLYVEHFHIIFHDLDVLLARLDSFHFSIPPTYTTSIAFFFPFSVSFSFTHTHGIPYCPPLSLAL